MATRTPKQTGIKRDDWLQAMRAATEAPLPETDALSVAEVATMFTLSHTQARRKLGLMVTAGTAQKTDKLVRRGDGGVYRVSAYRLVS